MEDKLLEDAINLLEKQLQLISEMGDAPVLNDTLEHHLFSLLEVYNKIMINE